jgi:hypothetical protein
MLFDPDSQHPEHHRDVSAPLHMKPEQSKETGEIPPTTTLKPLCEVGHGRHRGSLYLPCKSVIACKCSLLGHLIDDSSQLSGFSPGN